MEKRFLSRSFFRYQRSVHLTLPFLGASALYHFLPFAPLPFLLTGILAAGGFFFFRRKKEWRPFLLAAAGAALAGIALAASPFFERLFTYLSRTNGAHWIALLREKLSSSLSSLRFGAFFKASLLGDSSAMPKEWLSRFSATGTRHLLAVSGLHVSILLGFLSVLPAAFPGGRGKNRVLILFALSLTVLTGFSPSVLRAVFMTSFFLLGRLFRRQADSLAGLFSAAALILFFSPETVADAGFLLSFFATLGILALGRPVLAAVFSSVSPKKASPVLSILIRFAKGVLSAFLVTLSATTFTLPVTLVFFREILLLTPLYNLLLVPLMAPVLIAGVLFLLFSFTPASPFFGQIADAGAHFLLFCERLLAGAAPSVISLSEAACLAASISIALFFVLFFVFSPSVRQAPVLFSVPYALLFFWHFFFRILP